MKVQPKGDANCYWLLSDDGKKWIAEVRFNGELYEGSQEQIMARMAGGGPAPTHQSTESKPSCPSTKSF